MATNKMNIAVIPGDGIGKEVVPEGIRVLNAAAVKFGLDFNFDTFDFEYIVIVLLYIEAEYIGESRASTTLDSNTQAVFRC